MTSRRTAQNIIKAFSFVERDQVPGFGQLEPMGDIMWGAFAENPVRFFIRAPSAVADQIWAAIPEEVRKGGGV